LGELFGKSLVLDAGGVQVGFRSLGADSEGVAGLFQRGDAGVGIGSELFQCALVVGADTGGLVDRGGLDVLGPPAGEGLARLARVSQCRGGSPSAAPALF
jgi:hypothetical protein